MVSVRPRERPPIFLLAGFGVFVLAIGYLVVSSLTRRNMMTYEPTSLPTEGSSAPGAIDTVTIDARSPDRWQLVDLDAGLLQADGTPSGWDLAIRRFHVVPARAAADLGTQHFTEVARAPDSGYIPTVLGTDTTNAATRRWYAYGMLSHLLESKGHVYVIESNHGRHLKLEILSYYCPGLEAGCLTFRYAWLPE